MDYTEKPLTSIHTFILPPTPLTPSRSPLSSKHVPISLPLPKLKSYTPISSKLVSTPTLTLPQPSPPPMRPTLTLSIMPLNCSMKCLNQLSPPLTLYFLDYRETGLAGKLCGFSAKLGFGILGPILSR